MNRIILKEQSKRAASPAQSILRPPMSHSALGKKPTLLWIDKRQLKVDDAYQRKLDGRMSQRLISHLAVHFTWAKCGAIIVAPSSKEGEWLIIDGQHRHAGAMRIDSIRDLPCLIVDAPTQADQAAVFIDLNSQRVNLTTFSIFHAKALVGDALTLSTMSAAAAAGVTIMKYPVQATMLKPGTTLAIKTLVTINRLFGPAVLTMSLKAIREAWPERGDGLRARVIDAVAAILNADHTAYDHVVTQLARTEPVKLEIAGRTIAEAESVGIARAIESVLTGAPVVRKPPPKPIGRPTKAKVPFQFDRSNPVKPKNVEPSQPSTVDAPVRRFEPGTIDNLIRRTFDEAGVPFQMKIQKSRMTYAIRGKQLTQHEFMKMCNKLRVKAGKEPLQWTAQ